MGLSLPVYVRWMVLALAQGLTIWFISWGAFSLNKFGDNGLFALGDLCFSLGIVWTNSKLLVLETHYKTVIVGIAVTITIAGWWAWNGFMAGIYSDNLSPYDVKGGFTKTFGNDPNWWLTLILALTIMAAMELMLKSAKHALVVTGLWPPWTRWSEGRRQTRDPENIDVSAWQEMEKDPAVGERLRRLGRDSLSPEDEEEVSDATLGADSIEHGVG